MTKRFLTKEPIIHSHITDVLPNEHPLASKQVYCDNNCDTLVHAGNNECMQTWFETEYGNYCTMCFMMSEVLESLESCLIDGHSIRKIHLEAFANGVRLGRLK